MSKVAQPKPASGQIWRAHGTLEYVLDKREPGVATSTDEFFSVVGRDGWFNVSWGIYQEEWSCVGVDTPAGRVMVGERREAPSGVHTVLAVASPDGPYDIAWAHTVCDRDGESHLPAVTVASWSLLPALGPLATAAPQASESKAVAFDRVTIGGIEVPCKAIAHPVYVGGEMIGTTRGVWEFEWTVMAGDLAPHLPSADPLCAPIPNAANLIPQAVAEMQAQREIREARRREIDDVLREDARRHPAFATARRGAVMAAYEGAPPCAPEDMVPVRHAENILRDCHRYETKRGGMTKPSAEAVDWARHAGGTFAVALAVYERARSLP